MEATVLPHTINVSDAHATQRGEKSAAAPTVRGGPPASRPPAVGFLVICRRLTTLGELERVRQGGRGVSPHLPPEARSEPPEPVGHE